MLIKKLKKKERQLNKLESMLWVLKDKLLSTLLSLNKRVSETLIDTTTKLLLISL